MSIRSFAVRGAAVGMAVATLAGSVAFAGGADGKWSDREVVRRADRKGYGLQVELGPRGYAVLAWISGVQQSFPHVGGGSPEAAQGRVWVSVRPPGGAKFRDPKPLSGRGARGLDLEMARNGQTVVTWNDRRSRVLAAFRDHDSAWTDAQRVTGPGELGGNVAIGPDGWAVLAWRTRAFGSEPQNEKVRAAMRPPGGKFGRPVTVAEDPGIGNWGPDPAVGKHGRALIVWTGACANKERLTRVSFLRRRADKPDRWSSRKLIPNSACPTAGTEVAMSDKGRAVVVVNGTNSSPIGAGLRVAVRQPGEPFGRARRMGPRGTASFADVETSRKGRAVVAWDVFDRNTGAVQGVQVAAVRRNGTFTDHRRVSPRRAGLRDLAVGARGHAVVLWHALDSGRIKAAYSRRAPAFGPPETVTDPITTEDAVHVVAAINGTGRAIAAWGRPHSSTGADQGVFVSNRKRPRD